MIWFLLGAALALALVVTLTLWSACVVAGWYDENRQDPDV
jgi:hypothetical protein